jgi:hypothetical protein
MIMIFCCAGVPIVAAINALGWAALPVAGLIIWAVYRHRKITGRNR